MKKILIIGGGGYVGTRLVEQLINKNYFIKIFDLFIYGEKIFDQYKNVNNFEKIKGDIRNINLLSKSLKDIYAVIHLACISNDPSFDLDPNLGKSINFSCFEPLIEVCKNNKIKRFIYASSSSVYGSKKEDRVTEDLTPEPQTDYAKFKLKCEKILLKDKSEMIKTIVRPSTICGYSDRQRFDLTVNIFTNQAMNNNKIIVHGGNQMRPALHILDMCKFYEFLIEADSAKINNKIYNISKENFTILDIANRIKKIVKKNNLPVEISDTLDNRSYKVCADKALKELKFKPVYEIEHAVKEIIEAQNNGKYEDPINNPIYFNIKRMKEISLK
jgi:nucleoside-diphosphate-sugar epimerase